jgi:hypothetical protein
VSIRTIESHIYRAMMTGLPSRDELGALLLAGDVGETRSRLSSAARNRARLQ